MEKSVPKFQSVVEAEQLNVGPQQKQPLAENENPARRSNLEQGIDKSIKRRKGVIRTGKKVYRPPLPSTYKETEISEELNDGMEWVFRYYRRLLNQTNEPLSSRDDIMELGVLPNTNGLEKNLKLQGFPSDL